MSTGGPPAGIHIGGNKGDRGLVSKLKDAIKPGSSSAKKDSTSLPGGAAHESQDRGGGGVLNALKPGTDNMEGRSSMPADARGFQPGIPGGPGMQGVGPSNSTVA
ncbi:hypothetical protein PG997_001607 [Apiospora hydei]|uniref:Uncharacterized protein n=1 Tax=Apiospora hydei TaxID=1337664 RepID=A0ABR1XED3_9PEZI